MILWRMGGTCKGLWQLRFDYLLLFFPDSQMILIQNTSNRRNGKVAAACQFQEVLCLALSEWCDPCLGASLGLLKHARKISVPVSLFQSNCEKWQKQVKSVLLAEGNGEQGNMEAERMRQTIFIVMSGGGLKYSLCSLCLSREHRQHFWGNQHWTRACQKKVVRAG